ncbi:transcription factor WhiB [Streptomyces griseoincarnatus]
MSGWIGGVQVRGLDRDQIPVGDFLCTACRHHERVRGRDKVTDWLRANPGLEHQVVCQARQREARRGH